MNLFVPFFALDGSAAHGIVGLASISAGTEWFVSALICGIVLVGLGIAFFLIAELRVAVRRSAPPYRSVHLVLLLRDGERYARALEQQVRSTDFADAAQRARALTTLASLVRREDVMNGFYDIGESSWSPRRLGRSIRRLFDDQRALSHIAFDTVNLGGERALRQERAGERTFRDLGRAPNDSPDRARSVREEAVPYDGAERPPNDSPQRTPNDASSSWDDGVALVAVFASAQSLGDLPPSQNLADELMGILWQLASSDPDKESHLYLFYSPSPGRTLSQEAAATLFDRLLAATM